MDIELNRRFWAVAGIVLGVLTICPAVRPQDKREKVLLLNAEDEINSCLYPVELNAVVPRPNSQSRCSDNRGNVRNLFLVKGKRTELRVFNRKFLTTYSITIDAVTTLQTFPAIRNLNEASNLSLGSATLIAPPTAKGGTEGLTSRTAEQVLFQLLGEGTAARPKADLDSDRAVFEREGERIKAELKSFEDGYELLAGERKNGEPDCQGMTGTPDAKTLTDCLHREVEKDLREAGEGPPFRDEDGFRRIVLRAQDLIQAVNAFGAELASSDLPAKEQKIETDVAQYQNDAVVLQGNLRAAEDAARLAEKLEDSAFGTALRREQLKYFLLQQLKVGQSGQAPAAPTAQDEADLNELLDRYTTSLAKNAKSLLTERRQELLKTLFEIRNAHGDQPSTLFSAAVQDIREKLGVRLLNAVNDVNKKQSTLLNRINEIYDHSEVQAPLVKAIDISGHPGNLIVYYTIRRIETFTRFTIAPVGPLRTSDQSTAGGPNALPMAKGTGATDGKGAGAKNDKDTPPPGIVVSSGSFEVHAPFRFNIGAAFAFSSLKDQSISKEQMPLSCLGTATTPDTNCFTPVLNGTSHEEQVILAVQYYIHERDTFPLGKYKHGSERWLCEVDFLQCFGPMAGISLNTANSYFAGVFFEPVLGFQFSGGANFGAETTLQKGFQFGTPADVTGGFPTYQKRATGWFVSAGMDLAIFRKIFGKVTGVGTAATSTQGQ